MCYGCIIQAQAGPLPIVLIAFVTGLLIFGAIRIAAWLAVRRAK